MGAGKDLDISGAKGGSDKPKSPTEAPDSLRSIAVAKMLIAMGEGEFAGNPTAQDIYLDNTPLQDPQGNLNFPNVKWEFRGGSVEQGYIQGIPSVENETTLGIELRSGTPWVRAISNSELSAVRLRFAWPALQSVDSSGNVNGYRIEYKVEVATDGGSYQPVLSEAVDGKTTSTYERTRRIDLPPATSGWLLRVTRITPNKNNNKIADTMQIAGFTEVIDAKLRYPNTALLYIEFSAEQFRNIPAVTVDCRARKWQVPSNYDPDNRTYNGIWDGTFKQAWTDNPAWVTYGITVNDRFGLGRRIKPWQVDKWELYRIAQYCDQLVPDGKGGQEPRFICNLNLQGKADAWSLLRDISAIYRGMTYWAQGQVFTLSDMPRATDFDFAYTRANVIDGKFTYSSSSERTRYSRALISYDNPANNYDTDVTAVTDTKLQRRYGDSPLEISAIGCTRESEAQRRGKWALLTNSKDRGITFKVGLDGRIPLPGYVIPVADELLAGRAIGGRISAVSGRVITLDRDTQAKAGDRLILNLPNGKCEGRTVQLVNGRKVTVTVAYSTAPEPQLVWALDADDLAIPLYRVTSVSRPEPGVFEITAIQYDPSKFAHIDTGARLEERPISVIPISVVPAPVSVTLTSHTIIAQGLAITTMTIAWPSVPGAVAYDVEWRKDSGNWIRVQRTGSTSVDVSGIYAGAYLARVRAVSAFDISSIWKSSSLTQLKGKVGLPPAVTLLTADSLLFGIGLKWGFPVGTEDTQRTEIWYGTTTSVAAATKLADLAYPQRDYSMQSLQAGAQFFFWARLIDRTGNVGPWYPTGMGVMGQASSDAGPILDQIAGQIGETELGKDILDRIELIDGPPTLAGSVAQKVASEAAARAAADLVNTTAISKEVTDRAAAVLAEAQARAAEDVSNAGKIIQEATDRAVAVLAEAKARGAAITSEANTRSSADSALSTRIDTVTASAGSNAAAIQTEITARTNADSALGTRIDTVAASTASNLAAIGTEITARTSADSALGTRIDTVVATATTDRNSTSAAVTGEATARANADTALGSRIDTVSSALPGKADASAVSSLTNRVESAEGTISSQGAALTGLTSSLTTTNYNVTAAQNAANAANTLAGGKGKVLVQTAVPAAGDRLVQNLWIDITGGANTPKRWTGSAWVAVTDKVATDAATAAANALTVANTKADASAVNSLTTRVTSAEGTISSQGSAITGLTNSLTTTNTNVTAAQGAAQAASDLAGGKGKVITQSATPAAADRLAQNLWIDTTGNTNTPKRWSGSTWVAVTDKVATDAAVAAANALSVANTKADASAVNSLTNRVTSAEGTITSQGTALTGLTNSLTTTNNNVMAAQNAANAASTLAGGKGKVIVQASAPAAADQLVQNLWIDIAGGANTPKRWTGSAWAPVTDKVATDAAAAAASALSQVATKAEAATVQALSNAVTQQGSSITAQGSAITSINTSLGNISQENLLLNPEWKVGGYLKTENASYTLGYANRGDAGVPAGAPTERVMFREIISASASGWGAAALIMQDGTMWTPATAGEVINVSCWIYCENPVAGAGKISLTPAPLSGTSIPAWGNKRLFTYQSTQGGWQRLTAQVTLPDTTERFAIYVTPDTTIKGFKMWVSDLVVTKQSPEGAVLASATTALDARVTTTEGTITSQGTAITGLSNSLNTTNTNVMAAQNAAQAASDLAGGKGKVITQSAAPAVADRLAQNLWIDTTGNTNTPKRWNGTAWVAVTDKVATDAAAAAANALSQVATKAEAATVQALSNTVTQQGNTITAQGNSLTSITAAIGGMTQENIVLDPTFNVGKEAFNPSGAVTIVPRTDPSIPPNTPVPRVAKWVVQGSTTANTYIGWGVIPELRNPGSVVQMSVAAGEVYEFSADVFMEASGGARQHGFWMQMYDATGTGVGHAWVPGTVTNKSGEWETLSGKITIAPTAVTGRVTFRMSFGEATNLWICNQRWTKQTAAQAANASAQSALDARVTQAETGLTTQAGQIVALNTGVAGKADNSALQSLMSTVTQQGSTLTSQGTAVTQLQSTVGAIGGSGSNLLPDAYSWLSSAKLPATFVSTLSRVGVEVAGAASGFGVKLTLGSVVTSQFLMLSPTNNASGFNVDMETGGYLVSMYVQGSVDGTMRVSMYNGSHRWSSTVAYTTTRQRLVFVCTATAFARASITIYPNMAGLPAGTDVTIDSVMIEKQIGISTEPSPFVAGSSAMTSVGQATAISSLDTRVTETEGVITAQASKLDGIYVQVNPVLAGEATGFAGSTGSLVGVWSEQSARIEDGVAQGLRTDIVQAQMDDTNRELGKTSATVQETSSAIASLDGKVSATWSVKLQVNSLGQYVAAGVGLGIENTPAGLQSQFLVSADRFAVVNGINGVLSSPFVVNQGQVFIKEAFIANGSITMLKIGDTLQSDNFVAGIQGWRLNKSGQFEINGHVPGQGTMVMTNRSLRVYDSNNVKRVQLGDLSE